MSKNVSRETFCQNKMVSKKSAYYLHLNRKERRKNMYKINPPKIHLSTVLGYDVEGKRYIVKDEKIFDTERELVCFLARYNRPVCNFEGGAYSRQI